MSILISLKNINLAFGQKIIFNKAELTINKGDRIGLIGLNGQGKSTLFNIIMKKVIPDISTPSFIYDRSNEKFDIFYIPQEMDVDSFPGLTLHHFYLSFYPDLYKVHCQLNQIATDMEKGVGNLDSQLKDQEKLLNQFEQLGGWEIQNAYTSYLKSFGLEEDIKDIAALSGGEKRKIALSIGLSSKAEFLLWDEPTNHLDIETIEKFEDELMSSKKTYMIISHDRYLLNHTTDRICHIERGQINTFQGTYLDYLEYLEAREKELQKNLSKLENRHRRELAWMRQGIKARGTRSKKRVEGYNNIVSGIKEFKEKAKKQINLNLQHSGRKTKILVDLKEVNFSYANKEIFNEISISVAKKDKIALIGPNGAGKSTLIKLFNGDLLPTEGELKTAEQLKIVVFDQHRKTLPTDKTPFEVIGEGVDFVVLGDGSRKHIVSYLEDFLFNSDQVHRPIETLSGGEKNRLQLAMFMKQAADLWVFDEPTNDLDIETIELLEDMLKNYEDAVIIIGHDRAFLDNVCEKTWLINEQQVEEFVGGYTQVAPYLHALELERELKNNTPAPKVELKKEEVKAEAPIKNETKPTMSYNEKRRWKVIEKEIADQEDIVMKLEEELSQFDYSTMDQNKQEYLQKLTLDKEKSDEKLQLLYEEWEDLSGKSP